MDPGPVQPQLQVSLNSSEVYLNLQGIPLVEEMLILAVFPIMSLYHLPHGQYSCSSHVINLLQDVTTFANKFLHAVYQ